MTIDEPQREPSAVRSPCVRCCTLNEQDICLGCGRTLDEIRTWTALGEAGRAACVARAHQRLRDLGRPVAGNMPPTPWDARPR